MAQSGTTGADMLPALRAIAAECGELVMRYFAGSRAARAKADHSPVTDADLAAHDFISEKLARLAPEILLISEEGQHHSVAGVPRFWLVDPIDGTRSFVRGTGCFTVNIGLIESGEPVLGVINLPQTGETYGGAAGLGAWKWGADGSEQPIHARLAGPDGLAAMVSHSHSSPPTEEYLSQFRITQRTPAASSMKFCVLAEGKADLYPRHGRTMEWDTAAGHAILSAAGGSVETLEGETLRYGKPEFKNPYFVAWGKR